MRSFPVTRESHHTLTKGNSEYRIANVQPFGPIPKRLTLFLLDEDSHNGSFTNRYVYKPFNLSQLQVYTNGVPSYLNNRLQSLDLSKITNKDVHFFYQKFLDCYPDSAKSISLLQFFHQFFLFTIDLAPVDFTANKDAMSLISTGSIDISLKFHPTNTKNLVVYVHSLHHTTITFSATGEIISNN